MNATCHPAIEYLDDLFVENDFVFFQLVHAVNTHPAINKRTGKPRINRETGQAVMLADTKLLPLVKVSAAATPEYMNHLEAWQAQGWNVYVCMNPFPEGTKTRTEDLIVNIRNLYLDVDKTKENGDRALELIDAAVKGGLVPQPTSILESSPGNYHVAWTVEDFSWDQAKAMLPVLASKLGGDMAAIDLNRVLRLPGFKNLKKGRDNFTCHLVSSLLSETYPYTPDQFKLPVTVENRKKLEPSPEAVETMVGYVTANAAEARFELGDEEDRADGGVSWIIECPWAGVHTTGGGDAMLMVLGDGRPEFNCFHGHCNGVDGPKRGWSDIRNLWKEKVGHFQRFGPEDKTGLVLKKEPEAKTANAAVASSARVINFVTGNTVKPVRLKWLWPRRILADKLNVFSGEPDVGKGMTTVDLAARITRHLDFPDCKNQLDGPKDVLFLSSEDDMEDTIVPRLIVAGADMSRVHFVQISENTTGTIEEGIVCLDRDLPLLEVAVSKNPNIVLIIPDPVIAFLGDADPNKDKEVRPIYSKMKTFAKRLNVAWLFVNHWNKNQSATSINKTSGAKTMVSAPRATWMFTKSPEDPTRYLMMKGKGNLSKAGASGAKTLAYRIISEPFDFGDGQPADPDGVPKLIWDGETDHACDEVLADAAEPQIKRSTKAEQFLERFLAEGGRLAQDVYRAGDKEGLLPDKLKRARYQLDYKTEKIEGKWYWAKNKLDFSMVKARIFTSIDFNSVEIESR